MESKEDGEFLKTSQSVLLVLKGQALATSTTAKIENDVESTESALHCVGKSLAL